VLFKISDISWQQKFGSISTVANRKPQTAVQKAWGLPLAVKSTTSEWVSMKRHELLQNRPKQRKSTRECQRGLC
jgi:hypothetical protein